MTPYDDILDLALVSIEDYRLNKVAVDSPVDFKLILEGFMVRGLSNFDNCKKDLSDRNDELHRFNIKLDDVEKSIIADWTVITWLDKEINDTRQITSMLQNRNEAHRYSEANNLKAKTGTLTNVSSIAGYITSRNGKKYAFAIMIHDSKTKPNEKKSLEEYILRDIYTNY